MKNINEKIANLSVEKRALLELKLKNKKNKNTHIPKKQAIPQRSNHDSPPLSFAQERLWFLEQLETNNPFYNVPRAVLLQGNLNQQVLQLALSEIVRRHEVLRTSFRTVNGTPVQVIHPEASININVVDLQQHSEKERETLLQQLAQLEAITPFNLEIAPLIRCSLLQLDATEYVLLLGMHHIISDGWSIGVFIQEISTLYQAFCAGVASPLAELPIQYADFAVWQRQWLSGEVLQNQLNYWKQQLDGAPELLQLPTDRPRPSVQSYRGTTQRFTLNTDLTQKLQILSQESGTTLFMTLLAAFATLLYRYSGQSDILIGSAIANRNRSEIESLIGFFVNTLVLRTRFEDNPSFKCLLARVRETTLKAYEHQDLPFEQVVEALQPQRSLSHSPLFQVMFVLQNAPMGEFELSGVTWCALAQESTIAKFDLTLSITETSEGLVGSWEYNTDLFDGETIERMAAHFQNLLSAIVENPVASVSELPLLSEAERHQLLVEWNDTECEYPRDKCIHQLFEEQVERTPFAVAVVFENQQLTYLQLNQRANQLAHHLQSFGVGPEVLVGICTERSIEMVVGLLGILKAGGAYVPLDPNYPQQRLSYTLEDSGVEVLLTQQELKSSLPSHTARVVCLDTDWGTIDQHSQENLNAGVKSDNLAYVIYTSGSTGQPKGVAIEHQSPVALCHWAKQTFTTSELSGVLAATSICFDLSVFELFVTLCVGGKVIVAHNALHIPNLNTAEEITLINTVPSAIAELLRIGGIPAQVQTVNLAGEPLQNQIVEQLYQHENIVRVYNLYGPSEDTTYSTFAMVGKGTTEPPSIGRPISNTQIYIYDSHLQPVPIGVPGELYIGGDGLARGYLNRPGLTCEKFIQNPLKNSKSSRLYKTGDLARYGRDGNIEFLGRIDNQVKIRGFRIELGEIEAVLNTHPQIQQAVVIATEEISGHKRLVAYVVTDESLTTNQLRESLFQKLPEFMIPSAFVTLDTLPLTPNGKLDRKALPAPDGEITREHEYVEPRTAIEQTLTNIWQELLLKEKVSIHDNFFEIGGDSILSIQVVSRAKNSGIQITPKQIFQNQTIAELARVANTTMSAVCKQGLVTGVAPLTPIQHWFFAHNTQELHHFNQSVFLQIPNDIKPEWLEKAVKKLLSHHDALRLRFTLLGSEHKQINHGDYDAVPFTVVDLSLTPRLEQPQALEQIATEFQASLNLSIGPIMQVVMFNLGSEYDARLLIIIHHLAVDGVSWRILLSDLETVYQQLISEQPLELGAKTTAFIDWAEKLKNYAQSEIIKQELDYWLNQPWSKTTPLPLDYDRIKAENTVGSVAQVSVKLNVEETRALLGSVNEAYNTQINDILLSALAVSLAQWTANSTVVINLEGHGREELFSDVDLSRTVGWFTSLFPVLLQLPPLNQPAEVIKSIKEQLRAIPNRGIGYGILRYLCENSSVNQQLQTIITAEISFNYLGQFDQIQSQTGWKFAPESTGANHSSKLLRDHLLDINALVVEGELQINWTYSSNIHTQATVENLAQSYIQAIRSIIEHCQLEENTGYTPSDFPDAQLNQLELDELLAPIKTKNISAIYPLSPTQQGMLFHSLYAPGSGVYFEQMTLNLKGNLNVAAFEFAWQKVVDRHSVLRTLFVWENRQTPLQVVLKQVNLPLHHLDWQELSSTKQQQHLSELLQTQREQGFQFNQAPLMACTLVRLDEDNYKFIWNHHHILMDGWCLPIIFKEVISVYEAEARGGTYSLPTPSPYGDYIAWLNSQDDIAAIEFWRQNLQGFSAPTPLVVDKNQYQKEYKNSDYKELELRLSAQVSGGLQNLAQQNHVTLSTIVQAAWALLLSRYSDQKDVVFGVTTSGRPASLSGVEEMVGLFINTLPLRLQISPQQELILWLQQIQQLMLELQDYSYTPLVEIQSMSEVPGGIPLFESIVVFENYPVDSSLLNQGDSLQVTEIEGFEQNNYPLTVVAVPRDKLLIKISYDTVRFESDTIGRMLGHLQTIFSAIVENPSQIVGELPLLSEAERHQLLVEWNDTATEYPEDKCIHQLFESQVEKTPLSVAVVFDREQLTYQQLNQRANQLAHHLQTLGVGPEVLVGICVERSVEMVVGLLGILKAGGAYVPLDPNYPQERLSYMLADSGVEVLLTHRKWTSQLLEHQVQVICLDSDGEKIALYSQENPTGTKVCENLAYIIYTSGSTGKSKGVMITHQALSRFTQTALKEYEITASDRVLQFASINFDAAVEEIYPCLCTGATLVLRTNEMLTDLQTFFQACQDLQLTLLDLPTAYWHQLVADLALGDVAIPESLRLVIIGGEKVLPEPVRYWQQYVAKSGLSDRLQLINTYGPTETTVSATLYRIPASTFSTVGEVPIGRPLAHLQAYILDPHLQPVPIGVLGELYIGGDGLARGYLNRPELTCEKFIPNPFSDAKSSRLYKTGDLARYGRDGNIEFLGRIDNQVKIRGFRIELGEIEAVLNTHPQIQQAVVIATEEISGHKRLVAYVVTDESLTTNQLRESLFQKLPEYMIPTAFVTLDTLPLTPNGKVDRKALPAVDGEITREHKYVEPRTTIEQILTSIWQELLLKEKVSIHDNFFEIGGDSILSIQVVSRAKNSGIQITPKQIFQNQTIAELAQVANTTVNVSAKQGLITGVAPLTPIQHWFFAQNIQEANHYNQSVLLQISKDIKPQFLEKAVEKLLEHHDALRLRFTLLGSEYKQRNQSLDDSLPFTVVDLSSTPKLKQSQTLEQIATEFQASLNLSDGPIIQVVMFNLGLDDDPRLLIIIHHLAIDGVSWRIFLSDLETIYQQLIAQQPIQLSPKTTAFIDWAEKLNNYAQSERIKQELDYWLKQPWSKTTRLPLDYAQTQQENTVGSAINCRVKLSVEETRTLLESVNEAYNTQINDILLSALVLSLAQWTGNSAVVIDLEGHGREELFSDVDLSRTVGWFTSLFPVLLELPTDYQLASVIKSIKEQLRAIPNRGIGYGILRYLCKDATLTNKLQTIPTPEISFNYLGQFDQVQSQTGWKFASESTGASHSLRQNRDYLLDINALVVEGELQINWTYSSNIHTQATVENLAQSYIQAIRSIIEHCQLEENTGYTPSDFPDAQLNQLELDELLAPIKTKNISAIYPLSPTQQGMLFHSLYAPGSGVYFEQMTLNLKGNLNVAAFEFAWQKVVDRHSVLRTLFVWENRQTPLQVVLKQVNLPLHHLDWQELSSTKQQQHLSELLQTQREQGFQFNQAPLMACTLVRLDEDNYKFIWNHHHILMDGWCLPIIFKEVISVYKAEVRGGTYSLPTPSPYGDYIAWLNSQDHVAAIEFWRQTLQGFSAPTPLVVDKNQYQKEYKNSDYKELKLRLSAQVSRGLQDLTQQHRVTLSTIVQAAWALLLSRYSSEKDVVFGVTVSGRPSSLSGIENMVGLFINTLPLRLQISPQQELILWLQQIQQLMLELQDYSYTPLVEIQSMSEVPRGIPLFESIVVFENYPVDRSLSNESGSLQLSQIETFEQNNYPLTVFAVPRDELLVRISYDTVRFEEGTIERMLGHLQTIFCAIVENPSRMVGELPLLSEAERHQLLVEWNDTECEYPTDKCIHQLFEQQVERTSLSVAVVFDTEKLTYQQLNQRANQLAHHLQSLGVEPEVLVGICVERSIEMMVGLLGILKAGGAYVPLDPNYPQERLSYMLADSGVEVLLTQQSLLESLPQHQAQVVCLDTDWGSIDQHSQENLDVGVGKDNLAYVIYTSGSTGQPKGVEICHHSVVNFLNSMSHFPGLTQEDTFYAVTTISFDIAALELYLPLTVGAKVIVASRSIASNADSLLSELFKSNITVMQATPVTWQMLLAGGWSSHYPLKVLCGGEALSAQLAHQILETGSELWNLYGPTEATIWSTIYQLGTKKTVARTENALSPIGYPIANTQIYILDSHLQPVPIGVPGELYISGDGLARSYLNRPELTCEKFISNPFCNSKCKRLYKTGDLACYSSDGSIEFLGRIDNQVKVRGFRIELGEIESVLNTHPQIQQAVVIARVDIPDNKRLVAYIVTRDELLTTHQLREFIKQKLPEYMVPSAFVTLDTLPLTANGKVDRKALPAPDTETISHLQYIPPRNRTEEVIADIFASVLSIQKVGIHDNFFTLGGHSLLATQVIARVKQVFAVDVALRNLFEEPTVANLSKIIDNSDSPLVQQLQTTPFDQLENREEIEL